MGLGLGLAGFSASAPLAAQQGGDRLAKDADAHLPPAPDIQAVLYPPEGPWLSWNAPSSCPGVKEISSRLQTWLGAPLSPQQRLWVQASARRLDLSWEVHVELQYGAESGDRLVHFDSCEEAADFVALTIALAVDPNFSLADIDSSPQPSAEATAAFELETAQPRSAEPPAGANPVGASGEGRGQASTATRAEGSTTTPPSSAAGRDNRRDPAKGTEGQDKPKGQRSEQPASGPKKIRWRAMGSLRIVAGVLPKTSIGPAVGLARHFGRWQVGVDASFQPGGTYTVQNASYPLRMSWWHASLRGCRLFPFAGMSTAICAGLQGGTLQVSEDLSGVENGRGSLKSSDPAWLAALAGLEGNFRLFSSLSGYWSFYAMAPLLRPTISRDDGTELHKPTYGVQGDLGLVAHF